MTQWEAVSTHCGEMIEPPQKPLSSSSRRIKADLIGEFALRRLRAGDDHLVILSYRKPVRGEEHAKRRAEAHGKETDFHHRSARQLFFIVSLIQSLKDDTRANTLGVTVLPQIVPQLTTPTCVKPRGVPGVATTSGPPLSPWHEALVVP